MTMENGDTIDNDLGTCEIDNGDNINLSNINISDVIEVIQTTDPSFAAEVVQGEAAMISGGGILAGPCANNATHGVQPKKKNVYVKILEQPASKALRFRYECEGRSAGSIPGAHSTPENKTYPSIEIVGYRGRAVCVVSCVTKDYVHKPHPHNLVGKDCKKGVCTVEINSESMSYSFSNLGIQCVKKKDIEEALRVREEIKVDPYKVGFSHRSQPAGIDLNAVRLCFQVFLEGSDRKFNLALNPVVSDIIYDKKAMSDLVICKMSHCTASVAGGQEVILLCEKVAKEDINIRFFELVNNQVVWEDNGDFQHANVHKQVAIAFRTPKYRTIDVDQPVKVYIQLRRPSDNACSEPLPFELLPLDSEKLKRKRPNFKEDPTRHKFIPIDQLQAPPHDIASFDQLAQPIYGYNEKKIKMEPREQPPSPYGPGTSAGIYRNIEESPSPHHMTTPSSPVEYWHSPHHPHMASIPGPSHHISYAGPGPMQQNIPIPVHAPTIPENSSMNNLVLDSGEITRLLLEGAYQSRHESGMNIDHENMSSSFSRLLDLNDLTSNANNIADQYGALN